MNHHTGELWHHGIKGMHWYVRRYQNPDGSLTPEGRQRYLQFTKMRDASESRVLSNSDQADYEMRLARLGRDNVDLLRTKAEQAARDFNEKSDLNQKSTGLLLDVYRSRQALKDHKSIRSIADVFDRLNMKKYSQMLTELENDIAIKEKACLEFGKRYNEYIDNTLKASEVKLIFDCMPIISKLPKEDRDMAIYILTEVYEHELS